MTVRPQRMPCIEESIGCQFRNLVFVAFTPKARGEKAKISEWDYRS